MKKLLLLSFISLLGGVCAKASTNGFSLAIHFGADEALTNTTSHGGIDTLNPTDLAGVPEAKTMNWNNMTGAASPAGSDVSGLVADNLGAAVPVNTTIDWISPNTWASNGPRGENNGATFFTADSPDRLLMTGYIDTTSSGTTTITVNNLPPQLLATGYKLYIYSLASVSGRGGAFRVTDLNGVPVTGYQLGDSPANPATYAQDTGTNHTDTGVYLVFTNLVTPSIIIEATTANGLGNSGTPRAPINAIEFVPGTVTGPVVSSATSDPQHFFVTLVDFGAGVVDPTSVVVQLDGTAAANVVPVTTTKTNTLTRATYDIYADKKTFFVSGSTHSVTVAYKDTNGKSYTGAANFTVGTYTTIPTQYALPSVDASKPGFRAKVQQMDVSRNPGTGVVPNAERQIANGYIDPSTGIPYLNGADTTLADADGYFVIPDVINMNQDGPGTTIGDFPNDEAIPGISSVNANGTLRFVFSIETILDLKAGYYRFGVNSDDGFRLSAGRGPGDVIGTQLGTAGDRGPTDTTMDFVISTNGFYPFRLMWWQTGGGSECEFFVVNVAAGTTNLINDPNGPTLVNAYIDSPKSRPYVSRVLPTVNYSYAFADDDVVIDVTDGAIPLDAGSIKWTLNGATVTPVTSASKTASGRNVTTLTRKGSMANLLPSGANNNVLIYSYTDGGTTTLITNSWTYTVPAYTVPIPPANKVLASQVSGSGFHMTAYQMDRSLDKNQGNGGRYVGSGGGGNNDPRAEIQLIRGYINPTNNLPYPNLAAPGPNPDGSYDITDVLNFNDTVVNGVGGPANGQIFNGDATVPGLPGSGTSNAGLDNSVHEFTTYLNMKAGVYILGVNCDDGFSLRSSPNPHDTVGTLLGWKVAPGGAGGNPLTVAHAMNVIVPEDGIYPMRLLFWEGGGGVNLEFLSIDRGTGTQTLINDTSATWPSVVGTASGNLFNPITAYNTYTGPVRPWTKFSVYPLPNYSGWQNMHQQSGPGPILVKVGAGNPNDIANNSTSIRPFGDSVGAIVTGLNGSTVGMLLDGTNVNASVTPVPNSTNGDVLISYVPNPPMASGSSHTAGLVYAGATNSWPFTVITYVVLTNGTATNSNFADPTLRGFHVKVVQNNPSTGLANTAARAETQLAGTPANIALPGTNTDGSYTVPGIINWNNSKDPGNTPVDNGNFTSLYTGQPDDPIPGIPNPAVTYATTAAKYENVAAEIFAYLDLPAGYQKFGVNGDDGWAVKIGTPGVTNGPVLFTIDRAAGSADIPFAFITPEAGLYPVRLVYYQGGGGGNVEFFTYGPNNQKIPINDRNNPLSVKAYYALGNGQQPPPNPTISVSGSGTGLHITFTGRLQKATALGNSTVWVDVPNATSPMDIAPSATQGYWRAVAP